MTLEFGREHEKPSYIGMANTLIGPTAFIIPLLAGWLADRVGYQATFISTALGAMIAVGVLSFALQDQERSRLSEG
jgi:MFS family permease